MRALNFSLIYLELLAIGDAILTAHKDVLTVKINTSLKHRYNKNYFYREHFS